MEVYQALIIAAVTGGISSIATVASLKVEIRWVKKSQDEFKERLSKLEQRVLLLEKE
ncbi:hypothetical protein AB4242_21200 [Vibrio splendidus]|uniref:hypothetical protein n=1 Tax=Vibrio splendidus TaxID=29497 RepID=UPI00159EDC1B|nr:hypothetical protein [Vibrio splendidus]